MTATPPSQTAAPSPIENLPVELLEWILLETVDEVAPPIDYDEGGKKSFRWKQERDLGGASATRLLQVRLVCRKFRDMAWRAFGRVLGETVFDFGSRESIDGLHAIAGQRSLAPWIQKLTLSCNVLYRENYCTPHLSEHGMEELRRVRERNKSWIPDVSAEVAGLRSHFWSPDWMAQDTNVGVHIKSLVYSLQALNNVEKVAYIWDRDLLPQRYKNVWLQDCKMVTSVDYTGDEASGAHFGLSVFIEALASAGIQPRSLDRAVQFDSPCDFLTYAPAEAFLSVTTNVESLTLRGKYLPIAVYDMASKVHSITVTEMAFPLLRSLNMDINDDAGVAPIPFPAELDTPNLAHLTIINGHMEDETIQVLLEQYGKHLRRLDLKDPIPQCYDSLFHTIMSLNLEILVIRGGSEDYWADTSTSEDRSHYWLFYDPELDYMALAKEVVLEPSAYRESWERYWYSNGDE